MRWSDSATPPTGADLGDRQMEDVRLGGNGIVLTSREERLVFRQLPGVDLPGSDTAQHLVGASELFTLAVLAAGKLHASPDAVFFAMLDRALGAYPLLRERTAT